MPNKTWKSYERRIAKRFEGKRRGADYGNGSRTGKNDCLVPGWSIEVKVWEHPYYQMMLDEAIRAEDHRENQDDIPIAIIKRKGEKDDDSLVIMRLETFEKYLKVKLIEVRNLLELGYD